MPITALYAGLLTFLFVFLSIRVIGVRRGEQISVGDGDNSDLLRRIRVHGNFAEYVPLALLLIGLAESLKTDARLLHVLGIVLIVGRIMHVAGLSPTKSILPLRAGGMLCTFIVLVAAAVTCLMGSVLRGSLAP